MKKFITVLLSAALIWSIQQNTPVHKSFADKASTHRVTVVSKVSTTPKTPQVQPVQKVEIPLTGKYLWMSEAGISPSDYTYVDYIMSHESGWCPTKWEGEIGYCPASYAVLYSPSNYVGYGLCQSTPAIKMASISDDWVTNPVTQLKWCTTHALANYGSWQGAYDHWITYRNW